MRVDADFHEFVTADYATVSRGAQKCDGCLRYLRIQGAFCIRVQSGATSGALHLQAMPQCYQSDCTRSDSDWSYYCCSYKCCSECCRSPGFQRGGGRGGHRAEGETSPSVTRQLLPARQGVWCGVSDASMVCGKHRPKSTSAYESYRRLYGEGAGDVWWGR